MRSSLGAPHSTERCKITNFSQRTQIFTTFSIIQTSKSRYTTTTTTKTCKFTVHTTPLPTGEGLGVGLCGALCVFTFQSTPQDSGGSAFYAAGTEGYYPVPLCPDSDV